MSFKGTANVANHVISTSRLTLQTQTSTDVLVKSRSLRWYKAGDSSYSATSRAVTQGRTVRVL